jgi:hypothetical protein
MKYYHVNGLLDAEGTISQGQLQWPRATSQGHLA